MGLKDDVLAGAHGLQGGLNFFVQGIACLLNISKA